MSYSITNNLKKKYYRKLSSKPEVVSVATSTNGNDML